MTPLRTALLGAVLLLAFPATGTAAPMTFGSDLSITPNTMGASGTYTYAQVAKRTSSSVPAGAPQSGVLVKMKVRHNGSGSVKFRILSGASPNLTSRVARPDNSSAATLAVSGNSITEYDPVDGSGDPVGVPITAGEFIGVVAPPAVVVTATGQTGGTYVFCENDPVTGCSGVGDREAGVQGTVEPDTDGDHYGDDTQDACPGDATAHELPCPDPDVDDDGVLNNDDNCPAVSNADQKDTNGDDEGDACDTDDDGDGVADATDNCDLVVNADQANLDGDAEGDVCDADDDGDGAADASDNCPVVSNASQTNTDGAADGGDACDPDDDNDTIADGADNCERVANFDQRNTDGASDGGDACDADDDNDGVPDTLDAAPLDPKVTAVDADKDGSPAGADCNDNDAKIRPGAVEIIGNKVDENCDKVVEPFKSLAVAFKLKAKLKRSKTRIARLDVTGVPAGATVVVTCKGKRCPFASKTVKAASAGTVLLTSKFKKRKLRAGTVVTVLVAAPDSISRVATYKLRAGKQPKRTLTCATPDGTATAC